MRLSTPKRIVEKWIHRSRSRLPLGQLAGTLDWRVKERREGMGRVRGPDGRQRWVKAADLRPIAKGLMTAD